MEGARRQGVRSHAGRSPRARAAALPAAAAARRIRQAPALPRRAGARHPPSRRSPNRAAPGVRDTQIGVAIHVDQADAGTVPLEPRDDTESDRANRHRARAARSRTASTWATASDTYRATRTTACRLRRAGCSRSRQNGVSRRSPRSFTASPPAAARRSLLHARPREPAPGQRDEHYSGLRPAPTRAPPAPTLYHHRAHSQPAKSKCR